MNVENPADAKELSSISDALDQLAKVEPELAELVDLKFFCGFLFRRNRRPAEAVGTHRAEKVGEGAHLSPPQHSRGFVNLRNRCPQLSPDQWQALSPYLDEALGMTDEERSVWLSALRAQNPGLADQLEMLLHEHRALSEKDFLEKRSVGLPGGPGLAGQTLGVYTLVSQIGQGGMGSVWLAERNDGRFERRVAVKFLNIALMGKGGEERFRREGSILGRLSASAHRGTDRRGRVARPDSLISFSNTLRATTSTATATSTGSTSERASACSSMCCGP